MMLRLTKRQAEELRRALRGSASLVGNLTLSHIAARIERIQAFAKEGRKRPDTRKEPSDDKAAKARNHNLADPRRPGPSADQDVL